MRPVSPLDRFQQVRYPGLLPILLMAGCASFDWGGPFVDHRQSVVIEDDETQPVYSYEDAIRELVHVEASIDSDHDGELDRIALAIMRPKETNEGLVVATVMEASPYYSDSLRVRPQ